METLPELRLNVGIHHGKIISSWSCPQQHPGKSGIFQEFARFPQAFPHSRLVERRGKVEDQEGE